MPRDPRQPGGPPDAVAAQLSRGALLGNNAGNIGRSLAEAWFRAVLQRIDALRPGDAVGAFPAAGALARLDSHWLPELGAAQAFAEAGRVADAWLQAGLAAAAAGHEVDLRAHLAAPSRLSFAGHVLDLDGQVTLRADAKALRLSSACGAARFAATTGAWGLAASDGLAIEWPCLVANGGLSGRYVVAWPGSDPEPGGVAWPPPPDPSPNRQDLREAADATAAALRAIADSGSGNVKWLAPLFRGVAALPLSHASAAVGESHLGRPGVLLIGFPVSVHELSETFVKACSHQYLHLVRYFAPLDTGRDTRLYPSSLMKTPRAVDRILLAFHAAANVTLYWHDVVSRGGAAPALKSLAQMREHAVSLAGPLRQSDGLTPLGAAVWQVQWAALAERGLVEADRP